MIFWFEIVMAVEAGEAAAGPRARQTQSLLLALMVLTFNTGLLDRTLSCIRRQHDGNVVLLAFAAIEVSRLSVTALYRLFAALLSTRQSAESSTPAWRPGSRRRLNRSAGIKKRS